MATTPFFASRFLPRHHPLISNRLSSPGRKLVAMATSGLKNIGFVCHFPLWPGRQMVSKTYHLFVISHYGDRMWPGRQIVVFAPFYVSFICSSLDHFFSAQNGLSKI